MPTTTELTTAELAAELAELHAELGELRDEIRTRRDRTAESCGSAIDLQHVR